MGRGEALIKALVTGAGGFVGRALVARLRREGWEVRGFSRRLSPIQGDVRDVRSLRQAVRGVDVVFHAAAKVGLWGRRADFESVNVRGTANVLEACRAEGVSKLVFTGSPSVVFDGGDVAGVNESAPYPARFDSLYSETKAAAERLVLAAHSPELRTVSLRPHLVWGPGENHLVSRIVARGRAGRLRRIGGTNELIDATWVDDAAEAHWLAAQRPSGKAYFISSGDPRPLWEVVNAILAAHGLPAVAASIPRAAALAAAWACEAAYGLLGVEKEPPLTRFLVHQLSTAHWFDISAARRDLGYRPRVTLAEGAERLKEWVHTA